MQAKTLIDTRLQQTRGQFKSYTFWLGLLCLVNFVILFVFFQILGDHILNLAMETRIVMLNVLLGGGIAILITLVLYPQLRQVNQGYIARMIEKEFPEFKESLSTYVDIVGQKDMPDDIKEAVSERAGDVMVEVEPSTVIPVKKVMWNLTIMMIAIGLFFAYLLFFSRDFDHFLKRAFAPYSKTPYPTKVKVVSISPGNFLVKKGGDVPLRVNLYWSLNDNTMKSTQKI